MKLLQKSINQGISPVLYYSFASCCISSAAWELFFTDENISSAKSMASPFFVFLRVISQAVYNAV
eukprot:snap_masked-scaffold_36-processed-gene-1.28-mRNA-1 protein AED:1.00 eAED:1.00 QI:0/0/0/0/1/1/3/0/64